jgi:hypothetical protein
MLAQTKLVFSVVEDLLDVWWPLRRRRLTLFGHASHGFVQYLSYSSAKVCHCQLTGFDCESLKQKTDSYIYLEGYIVCPTYSHYKKWIIY